MICNEYILMLASTVILTVKFQDKSSKTKKQLKMTWLLQKKHFCLLLLTLLDRLMFRFRVGGYRLTFFLDQTVQEATKYHSGETSPQAAFPAKPG